MNIHDFIGQKNLVLEINQSMVQPQFPPSDLLSGQAITDRKEIYRNTTATILVMLNLSTGIFRISEPGRRCIEGPINQSYQSL